MDTDKREKLRTARRNFGRAVREAREITKMSQEQLSELSQISRAQISRIEGGRSAITIDTISSLCLVLGIEIKYNLPIVTTNESN